VVKLIILSPRHIKEGKGLVQRYICSLLTTIPSILHFWSVQPITYLLMGCNNQLVINLLNYDTKSQNYYKMLSNFIKPEQKYK
jgi:hypothetical protein